MIYAFDHKHKAGDICSVRTCGDAARAPVLVGSEVFADVPMKIVRAANLQEYMDQPIPEGWCLPDPVYGCENFYEIQTD
jgi:hypothetical protein